MLPANPDILFSTAGQLIWHDARQGRASGTPTVAVYEATTGATGTAESAVGAASVETNPNTTTDAACGPGSVQTDMRKVPVTATTGFVHNRQYLITDATLGRSEWIECDGIASADYIKSRTPLVHLYASGSAVVSTRIVATVDTTWASDVNNLSDPWAPNPRYRAAWTYVVGGVTYHEYTFFDLVRGPATHGVTGADVDGRFPGWLDRLPTDYRVGAGSALIVQAAKMVKVELAAIGRNDWAQQNGEAFNDLIVLQAEVRGQEASYQHGGNNLDQLARAEAKFAERFDKFMNAARAAEQTDSSGAGAQPDRRAIWSR